MKTKDIIITAVSLFLICAVSAGILGAVNKITAPVIAEIQQKTADESKSAVLPAAASFEPLELADAEGYAGKNAAGETVGYVFVTAASSYGGKLELMTGVDTAGAVTGVRILTINDTPGLGMNAQREEFRAQFVGKTGALTVTKSGTANENEIDALTSATITSRAVTDCVNRALALYAALPEKEG